MKTRQLLAVVVGLVITGALIVAIAFAAAVTIDTFDDGAQTLIVGAGSTQSDYASGSMLGGERDVEVKALAGIVVFTVDYNNSDNLSFSNSSGGKGLAKIQWDGSDSSMSNNYGLNTDLTDGGTNDVLLLRVVTNDYSTGITFTVYSGSTYWSYYRFDTPGNSQNHTIDFVIPFSSFTQGQGATGPADFTNVKAVEMELDATLNQDTDITIDLFEATSVRDFGDLPSSYCTQLIDCTDGGPRHIPNGLRLGSHVDAEADGQPILTADGDDGNDSDDEDGVIRDANDYWTPGASVNITVTVNGCSGTCYLNGWIDWNNNGGFDAGEQVFSDQAVSNGNNSLTINVPSSYATGTDVYARFRLCPNTGAPPSGCNSPVGETTSGGEVEDYYWQFGPTAVTVGRMKASSSTPGWVPFLAAFGLLGVGALGLMAARKRA